MSFSQELAVSYEGILKMFGMPSWEKFSDEAFAVTLGRLLAGEELPGFSLPAAYPPDITSSWRWVEHVSFAGLRILLGHSFEAVVSELLRECEPLQPPAHKAHVIADTLIVAILREHRDEYTRLRTLLLQKRLSCELFEFLYIWQAIYNNGSLTQNRPVSISPDDSFMLQYARAAFEAVVRVKGSHVLPLTLLMAALCERAGTSLPRCIRGAARLLDEAGYTEIAFARGTIAFDAPTLVEATEGMGDSGERQGDGDERRDSDEPGDSAMRIALRIPLKGSGRLSVIKYRMSEIQCDLIETWVAACRSLFRSRRKREKEHAAEIKSRLPAANVALDLVLVAGDIIVDGLTQFAIEDRYRLAVENLAAMAEHAKAGSPEALAKGLTPGRVTVEQSHAPGIFACLEWSTKHYLKDSAIRVANVPYGSGFVFLEDGGSVHFPGERISMPPVRAPLDKLLGFG